MRSVEDMAKARLHLTGGSVELLSAMRSVEDMAKARLHLTGGTPMRSGKVWRSSRPGRAASCGPDGGWPWDSKGRTGPGTQMTMQLEGSNVLDIDRLRGDL